MYRGAPRKIQSGYTGGQDVIMIKAFNKHYRKSIDLIENASGSEKIEMAEKVLDWFRQLPEEYVVALALFFNEVIDDLGDDSLEKISLRLKRKQEKFEEEEDEDELEDEEDEEDDDKEDY
jgi:phosphopantothenoylcysteine synthetase/decarboxylase